MAGFWIAREIISMIATIIILVIIGVNIGIAPFDSFWTFIGYTIVWSILKPILAFIIDMILLRILIK